MKINLDCKYVMIVTSEDDRYTGDADGLQLGYWADNPWDGIFVGIATGDTYKELVDSVCDMDCEGLFYQLFETQQGTRLGYGIIDSSSLSDDILFYESTMHFKGLALIGHEGKLPNGSRLYVKSSSARGVVCKDEWKFLSQPKEISYVAESQGEFDKSTEGYTTEDFVRICGGDALVAYMCFAQVDYDETPESWYTKICELYDFKEEFLEDAEKVLYQLYEVNPKAAERFCGIWNIRCKELKTTV